MQQTRQSRPVGGRRVRVLAAVGVAVLLAACGGDGAGPGGGGNGGADGGSDNGGATANHEPADLSLGSTLEEVIALAEQEETMHYCTGYRDDEWEMVYAAFKEDYPDVAEIEISNCQGTPPRERILAEWATGRFDVSLFDVASDATNSFLDAGLGATPDFSIFDGTDLEIDYEAVHPSGRVFGIGATSRVFIYNEELISPDELPDSFYECADPQYRGDYIMDIRPSGGYNALLTQHGEEALHDWAVGVAQNEPLWARAPAPIAQALLSGERSWVCGSQLHGPFAGFITWDDDGTIPSGQVLNMKPNTDNAHTDSRVTMMIGNYAASPNTALLFAVYQLAGHGPGPGGANPGYGDPWQQGTWKQIWFEETWGVPVLETEGGRWNDANLSDVSGRIIVDAWQDPVAVIE